LNSNIVLINDYLLVLQGFLHSASLSGNKLGLVIYQTNNMC